MKSRTSFFNTALKKDLTRFAPCWILYAVCMLLGLLLMADNGLEVGLPRAMAACIGVMSPVNLCYGLITAQLLFGDLYNSRLCFGLHTLPLRREGWFAAHVLSGILFSLIPTALMAAVSLPLLVSSVIVNAWQIALLWLLAVNLQYLFFFGAGVFSMLLSGNRMGSALVYALVNLGSMLAYYVADTIYTPLLYGVVTDQKPFLYFSPVVQFVEFDFVPTRQYNVVPPTGGPSQIFGEFSVSGDWWYLGVCAAVGLALMLVALALYRKRDLERCGDLMATKKLDPVFLVIYSVAVAALFQMVAIAFLGSRENAIFLFIGLAVGFFTGSMLIGRSTRVFRLKRWLGLLVLGAALAGSLLLTRMDPLGVQTRIPETGDIAAVSLCDYMGDDTEYLMTDPEDIDNIRFIHASALEDRIDQERLWYGDGPVQTLPEDADMTQVRRCAWVVITYHLKNGTKMTREYYIWTHQEEGQLARAYFSRLGPALGVEELVYNPVNELSVNGFPVDSQYLNREDIEALLEAIRADSLAGNLVQNANYHTVEPVLEYTSMGSTSKDHSLWVYLHMSERGISFSVYADMEHTMQWLNDRGIIDDLRQLYAH